MKPTSFSSVEKLKSQELEGKTNEIPKVKLEKKEMNKKCLFLNFFSFSLFIEKSKILLKMLLVN